MKTLRIGLTLAAVLAARLTLGQEAPPDAPPVAPPLPPADAAPSEPPATPPLSPSTETAPPPAPSDTPPAPPPTQPSSTAAFPGPPPAPPSATAPAPTVVPSDEPLPAPTPTLPPATVPSLEERKQQSKRVDDLAKKEKDVEGEDDSHGLFGPFRIGPVVGVGLPGLFSFGGAIKLTKYFGAGLNVGIVPELQFDYYGDATVSYQSVILYGHI